jgi:acetyl-CoA C-acetyltransferase
MKSVIVAGARTPIGKLLGSLSGLSAMELGGIAIKEALSRAGVAPDEVDYVVMGQVLQAGQGQITARQAATLAGIPMSVPATTLNKVCLSGLNAIHLADLMIRAGECSVVVAGGMESMSKAPHLLSGARAGLKAGDATLVDSMFHDGLFCAFDRKSMGLATEHYARQLGISRQVQDEIAVASHERAAKAANEGRFRDEIVAVAVPQRKGEPVIVEADEGVRPDTSLEQLAKLPPAFEKDGNITAGNASQISDGAAAVVVMSEEEARKRGVEPLAEIVSYGQVAGPDPSLLHQPSRAARQALEKVGLDPSAVSLYEINEAFAAVVVASEQDLGINHDRVNVNGGAIALGHPIGMSGTRLALTLALELRRRGGGLGVAALCGGGGQGDALVIRV